MAQKEDSNHMTMAKIQKKITNRFMHMVIYNYIKEEYLKKGVHPTVEQVIQDIDKDKLAILLQNGYTMEEITKMVSEAIGRLKK